MRTHKLFAAPAALLAAFAGYSALQHATPAAIADAAPKAATAPMQMSDITGTPRVIPAAGGKGTVLLFVSTQCPYSLQASPEMARIAKAYTPRGFNFIYVYGDSYENKPGVTKSAAAYGFSSSPVLIDADDKIVHAAGATNTPEAVVIGPTGKMLYRGRIDNRFSSIGVTRTVVTQHDLTDSLNAIAAGKAPAHSFMQPVGCSIH